MNVLVVLALVAMVYSAPIQDDTVGKTAEDMVHSVSKRTDEQIFFGNQQNAPRVKKADPDAGSRGLGKALPDDELTDANELPKVPEETEEVEQPEPSEPKETAGDVESSEEDVAGEKENLDAVDKSEEVPEDVLKEDHLLKAETGGSSENTVDTVQEEGSGDVEEPAVDEMNYDYLQKLYNGADERMPYDYYYPDYYLNYRKKRNTALDMDDGSDVVKRNHRAKRDLGYDDLADSYFPSTFDDDQYYNEVVRKRAVEAALDEAMARELAPLLEKYQSEEEEEEEAYPERYDVPSYLEYLPGSQAGFEQSPYDVDAWNADDSYGAVRRPFDVEYRQPFGSQVMKRQMLSMVPGSRRKRFNYPYSQEPNSHWGAFVDSEKRGQEAAYDRLYRLARALATRRSPYDVYFDEDEYKKK